MDGSVLNATQRELRDRFAQIFPEYDRELRAAKSDEEIEAIRMRIAGEYRQKAKNELGGNDGLGLLDDAEHGLVVTLKPEIYQDLVDARNGGIETKLLLLMDSLQRLQDVKSQSAEAIAYTLFSAGVISVTAFAAKCLIEKLILADELLPVALEGVNAVGPSICCNIVIGVIVALLIPLIYFINKPAACIMLVINELHQDLEFVEDYNVHGKRLEITDSMPRITVGKKGTFYSAGFFATSKCSGALIGTQYGLTLKQTDIDRIKFNFGVGCPLSQGKNNCACDYDKTAKSIAGQADEQQKQEDSMPKDRYNLSIRCNSGSGSVVYYVARISSN